MIVAQSSHPYEAPRVKKVRIVQGALLEIKAKCLVSKEAYKKVRSESLKSDKNSNQLRKKR